ncbi:sensor histidine kinase [Halobaculum sp. MBLA0147]|uniref:sensor histidine kinase n=1 Tax=Halobaculum sp. MBLA0147 TaxID=3079934 RepID=UPI0035266DF8
MAPTHDGRRLDSRPTDTDESEVDRDEQRRGERADGGGSRDRGATRDDDGDGPDADVDRGDDRDGETADAERRGDAHAHGDEVCARDGGAVPEQTATDYPGAADTDGDDAVRLDGETVASVVSHDLRNPLDVAKANLQVARETGEDEYLAAVADAHDRMEEIIDDVLALARVGEVTDTEPVALATVVEHAWGSVATDDAELRIEGPLPTAVGDADTLERLFENLFRNSVEHAGDAPTVCVGRLDATEEEAPAAAEPPSAVGFYVADDGPGIPVAERERVFESGYSADGTGTGLGLAIARRIVSAHGWSVAAVDGDGGARFEVTGLDDPSSA